MTTFAAKKSHLVVEIDTTIGNLKITTINRRCPLDHENCTQLLRSNIPQTALVATLDTYDFRHLDIFQILQLVCTFITLQPSGPYWYLQDLTGIFSEYFFVETIFFK
jgi:hypothetical protein